MTTNTLRRMRGMVIVAVAGLALVQAAAWHTMSATASDTPMERAASVRRAPRPLRVTTTVRPAPTTTAKATTSTTPTTAAPTTTAAAPTVKPVTTTTRPPTTTTTKAPTPTTVAPPAPTTVAPAPTGGLTQAAQVDLLALVNAKRATGTTCGSTAYPAVPPLALQGNLTAAADGHARDMATKNYFSHTGLDGSTPPTRMTAAGYRWSAWAENIAAGQTSPTAVVAAWFASEGHCVNFMRSTVTQVGFGKAENPSASYRIYWVADLGRPA